jgi:hypothetical protein
MIEIRSSAPRSAEDLRAALDESTEDLRVALEELERRARWEISLGRRIAQNAAVVLTAGFVCGAVIGAFTGGK